MGVENLRIKNDAWKKNEIYIYIQKTHAWFKNPKLYTVNLEWEIIFFCHGCKNVHNYVLKFDLTVKESFKTTKRELIPDPMNQSELAMRNAIQHSRLRVTKIRC